MAFDDFEIEWGVTFGSSWAWPLMTPVIYLGVLWALNRYMKKREGMSLKWFALPHNIFLCGLSLAMVLGILHDLLRLRDRSIDRSYFVTKLFCRAPPLTGGLYFWSYIYYLSKFYELLDSVLIVLKKTKPLSFLHVFHHTVMLFTPYLWLKGSLPGCWLACLFNSTVHVIMYAYYAGCVMGLRLGFLRRHITALQISQFIVGLLIMTVLTCLLVGFDMHCTGDVRIFYPCLLLDVFFLFLFGRFYWKEYRDKKSRRAAAEAQKRAVV
ncbi:putative steroid isomerase [Paratrimastix pyriformis]|uniref:Elongation of fatty acids protein n=1 Tax=Paratrimastix pyriformis TaxID=342808 RepID=A0ABQ8UHT2_9EUKA|nr:putative steroid isomerase [Paratrimastix pyriformis]